MKNKKLLGLLIGLAVVVLCFVVLLSVWGKPEPDTTPTEPTTTEPVVTTEPATEPATTEAPTEPATEEPQETTEEPTEPATTQGNNTNNGTGGGYVPGDTEPTDPESTEPPEIEVPAAGAENNPYFEQFTQPDNQFDLVQLAAGESVYYVLKTQDAYLQTGDAQVEVIFNGVTYPGNTQVTLEGDANGMYPVQFVNRSDESKATTVSVLMARPLGHKDNPQVLTELSEHTITTIARLEGYYLTYTAPATGIVMFQIWEYPTAENAITDIQLTNETSGKTAGLWITQEDVPVQQDAVSVEVMAGDVVTVWVSISLEDAFLGETVTLMGGLYGTQENPIVVQYPGFTANVPAGTTLYYQGYNMAEMTMTLLGENVSVFHAEQTYVAENGSLELLVTAEGRMPSVFAITNTADTDASYTVTFAYPLGHMENPDTLPMGTVTVTRKAGDGEYYLEFVPEENGNLLLLFEDSNWYYIIDNLDRMQYGDTQYGDSDSGFVWIYLVAGEKIQLRVNTYNLETPWEAPEGTVTFYAEFEAD